MTIRRLQHTPPSSASAAKALFRLKALSLLLVVAGLLTPSLPTSALAVPAAPQAPQLMLAKVYQRRGVVREW
jgi:hypothetical protein